MIFCYNFLYNWKSIRIGITQCWDLAIFFPLISQRLHVLCNHQGNAPHLMQSIWCCSVVVHCEIGWSSPEPWPRKHLGPVSISDKTSYGKISQRLVVARFVFRIVRSLCNLTDISSVLLPMGLSNFRAIRRFKLPISWLSDFARSYDKTSYKILKRGPGVRFSIR